MKHIIATEDGKCTRTGVIMSEDDTQMILTEAMVGNNIYLSGTGTHPLLEARVVDASDAGVVVNATNIECNILSVAGSPVTGNNTALFQDRRGTGVDGGDSIAGVQTRVLNHTVLNTIEDSQLLDNEVWLPAGKYWFRVISPVFGVEDHRTWFYDSLVEGPFGLGLSQYANPGFGNNGVTQHIIELHAPARVAVQQRHQLATTTGYGLGRGVGFSPYSVFTQLIVTQLQRY